MLTDLPTELLNQVVSYSPASSIGHLSQSSRALHNFVEAEGWRTFTQTNFPSFNYPPLWRDAAHSLTTLSRNWQRRAFIAQFLEPARDVTAVSAGVPVKKWRRPAGQTMGFQPALDSYEQFLGGKWNHRREVVAWSAGAELVIRVKLRTSDTEEAFRNASPQERQDKYDSTGTRIKWWSYRPFSSVEGRDDITSVKILKQDVSHLQHETCPAVADEIVIGTANGDLQLLRIPADGSGPIKTYFVTNGVPVRSTSLSPNHEGGAAPLLAANLSDAKLALYKVDAEKFKVAAVSEINAIPQGKGGCRIWSTRFVDSKRLVVGLGPSAEPINVFEIRPDGIVEEPIRRIGLNGGADPLDPVRASSVYPVEPLVDTNGGQGDGNLFLSGGYDGIVRLHDLRSPAAYETMYQDPTDDTAVYSLLPRGRDKVVVGTSRHCLLKVFDLRVSGGSQYNYAEMKGEEDATVGKDDWNIFLNPRDRYANSTWRGPHSWMRRSAQGSVYSLSSPSPTSPFIYVGVENAVAEFNFSSVRDPHPDTIFSAPEGLYEPGHDAYRKPTYYRNKHDVLNLAMYSQRTNGANGAMKLRLQRDIDDTLASDTALNGLDERWKENK